MSHDPHTAQPGYAPSQVLVDGCAECEQRGTGSGLGIAVLDPARFAEAWRRAADWQRDQVSDVSRAEAPMLTALWAVQVQLERRGVPIGEVPYGLR